MGWYVFSFIAGFFAATFLIALCRSNGNNDNEQ